MKSDFSARNDWTLILDEDLDWLPETYLLIVLER